MSPHAFQLTIAALQHHMTLRQIALALITLMHQVQAHRLGHRQYNWLTHAKGYRHSVLAVFVQVRAGTIKVGWR